MMNSTPAPTSLNRRSSRSNSTSSSVVTVKKTASLSSRSGSRAPHLKGRPISPEQFILGPSSLVISTTGKPPSARSRPSSVAENKLSSINRNVNRWSHSTTSSTSAVDNEQRRRRSSSTRRISIGTAISTSTRSQQAQLSQEWRSVSKMSPRRSPRKQEPPTGKLGLDSRHSKALPKITLPGPKAILVPSATVTPSTAGSAASSRFGTTASDYFGEEWDDRSRDRANPSLDTGKPVIANFSRTSPQRAGGHHPQLTTRSIPPSPQERILHSDTRKTGHSRNRDRSANGSTDTATGSSMSSIRSDESRTRSHRSPTQKSILSKALTKANTAVLLDNAQNFNGAIEAYSEACNLLQKVMKRSSDAEDKKKLSAICSTYANRIVELREMDDPNPSYDEKVLPDMPSDEESADTFDTNYYDDDLPTSAPNVSRAAQNVKIPPRLESMLPSSSSFEDHVSPGVTIGITQVKDRPSVQTNLLVPMQLEYMPPPLSPRRPPSPDSSAAESFDSTAKDKDALPQPKHIDDGSNISWLDTVDESTSSTSSSRFSSIDFRPRYPGDLADEIEAEFDAALNAAVEAAYPDGTDVTRDSPDHAIGVYPKTEDFYATEADQFHQPTTQAQKVPPQDSVEESVPFDFDDLDDEAEEEERLLEEMTRGYVLDDFHFDKRSKSALPRQSDSSGFSGRTWGSSVASTTLTSGTTLSTLAENVEIPPKLKTVLSAHPPPLGNLPLPPLPAVENEVPPLPSLPPPPPVSRPASFDRHVGLGVRDRRLSGQNAKQLKIETNARTSFGSEIGKGLPPMVPLNRVQIPPAHEPPKPPSPVHAPPEPPSTSTSYTQPPTPLTSIHSSNSLTSESPATSVPAHGGSQGSSEETGLVSASPMRISDKVLPPPPTAMRQNASSSNLKGRNLSINTVESTGSPTTAGASSQLSEPRRPFTGSLPSVSSATWPSLAVNGHSIGGMHLFDDQIGSPMTPRTPRGADALQADAPASLEPCPASFLLRPFWLMRCLYQTLAHPRGGYLTTKLFIPRDIWKVKNVKLKAIEDKISQCDLLTAALLKLAKVDHFDAEAVLKELQSFETVLDQVRTIFQKKLGSDVGVLSSSSLFRGSPSTETAPDLPELKPINSSNSAAKSFASGWRKLRSKSSGMGINTNHPPQSHSQSLPLPPTSAGPKDSSSGQGFTLPSLPITSATSVNPSSRAHHNHQHSRHFVPWSRRPTINLASMGTHAFYMGALLRLFDAAQILDQIARDVEDPGLKCSSTTHVGLEFCVRNAAEFFAFYILRFVLSDIGILVDKFIKRGGEWVMI